MQTLPANPKSTEFWVNDILHNDEGSTDEEIIDLFVSEGLTKEQAEKASPSVLPASQVLR